jgi:F0F1-type ATP synthase assembly protein I
MEKDLQKEQELKKKREFYRNQFFVMGLEIIVYFALPAVLGILLGKKLDAYFGTEFVFVLISLAVAYVLSWTIFLFRLRHVKKKLAETKESLKREEDIKTE